MKESSSANPHERVACMVTVPRSEPLADCCVQEGYVTLKCGCELPVMTAACIKLDKSGMPITNGIVNEKAAQGLRDSGCSSVIQT